MYLSMAQRKRAIENWNVYTFRCYILDEMLEMTAVCKAFLLQSKKQRNKHPRPFLESWVRLKCNCYSICRDEITCAQKIGLAEWWMRDCDRKITRCVFMKECKIWNEEIPSLEDILQCRVLDSQAEGNWYYWKKKKRHKQKMMKCIRTQSDCYLSWSEKRCLK